MSLQPSVALRRSKFDRSFTATEEFSSRNSGTNGFSRKASRCGRSKSQRRGTLGSISCLSFSQKASLVSSWRVLRPQAGGLIRKILLELEVASPKVKQIFYKAALVDAFNKEEENIATMDVHIKLIIKLFDDLLSLLDDEAECSERIKKIGAGHAVLAKSCSFSSDIWERLGEIAMERICTHEAVQKTREAARAWRTLLACLIDELRSGFDGEARVHRKSLSSEHLESDGIDDVTQKLRQMRTEFDHSVPFE